MSRVLPVTVIAFYSFICLKSCLLFFYIYYTVWHVVRLWWFPGKLNITGNEDGNISFIFIRLFFSFIFFFFLGKLMRAYWTWWWSSICLLNACPMLNNLTFDLFFLLTESNITNHYIWIYSLFFSFNLMYFSLKDFLLMKWIIFIIINKDTCNCLAINVIIKSIDYIHFLPILLQAFK